MRRHPRGINGFTLIELMVVVAIIGVLGSVAWPSIQGSVVRARAAELTIVRTSIEKSLQDAHMRNNFQWRENEPWIAESAGPLFNPPWDYGSVDPAACYILPAKWSTEPEFDAWKWLDFIPEGMLRGRYSVHAGGGPAYGAPFSFHTHVASDLNNNGICSARVVNWMLSETSLGSWYIDADATYGLGSVILDPSEI